MKRLEVTPGDRYGDLEVVHEEGTRSGKRVFRCGCNCGQEIVARLDHLRSGHTQSCGRCGLEFKGERKTLRGWAEGAGLKESTLRARLKSMSLGEALKRK